jgi:hypothetical protein
MKKFIVCLTVFLILGSVSVFAFSGEDLLTYPEAIEDQHVLLDFGTGLGYTYVGNLFIPPLYANVDFLTPLGGLPFTMGGTLGLRGYKWFGEKHVDLALAFRFAYHFNWTVPNLDTYAITTLGYMIPTRKGSYYYNFIAGVGVGARYYFADFFGAFAEFGYNGFSDISLGFAFKF